MYTITLIINEETVADHDEKATQAEAIKAAAEMLTGWEAAYLLNDTITIKVTPHV